MSHKWLLSGLNSHERKWITVAKSSDWLAGDTSCMRPQYIIKEKTFQRSHK